MISRLLRVSTQRLFSTCRVVRQQEPDFTHTIIGAGVVGLAIGAEISQQFPDARVLILEKNGNYGEETSSRNSEVVHGGLYYPEDSLKTQLCLEGKRFIYSIGDKIPVQRCGKWIIAQNEGDLEYLEKMDEKAKRLGVPTEFIGARQAKGEEPLIKARAGILHSPSTGITSAHSLMDYYYTRLQEADGSVALGTEVVGIKYDQAAKQYEISTKESEDDTDESYTITSNTVINSAGLHAPAISNMLLPESRHVTAYYGKGNYFSYTGKPMHIRRLIYPCPSPGVASLGTHLTIDLGGQIRFGPDLEWVDNCESYKVNGKNLEKAYEQVKQYIPSMELDNLTASYCGIRPKIIGPDEKRFQDFVIREEEGFPGFINLLGIESPGLTASMGIARYVCKKFI
ncbi:DEKNAAC101498 [Brettanomyces naardenensis]|uniref:L-2-hydroxyglutarate dehydrogenase, mitochondrial n=1 Tax=Brettanomyces naardenensis TaxID=13370 RepID=A0A448YI19_BRENA|nr:DEKNAAC101498 [Brettanomyces naardenensis]